KTEPWFGFCQLHVVGSLKCAFVETLYPYQRFSCGSGFVPCGTTHCAARSLPSACWARGTTMGPVLGCAGNGGATGRCAASGAFTARSPAALPTGVTAILKLSGCSQPTFAPPEKYAPPESLTFIEMSAMR